MNSDKLKENILRFYKQTIRNDAELKKLSQKINVQIQKDVHASSVISQLQDDYALRCGTVLSDVLQRYIQEGHIPVELLDGLSFNRAELENVLVPAFAQASDEVIYMCSVKETLENQALGFDIKYASPDKDWERFYSICDKMAQYEDANDSLHMINQDVCENVTGSIGIESARKNAERLFESGVDSVMVRVAEAKACRWCKSVAGRWDYSEIKNGGDMWRRHDNCKCQITVFKDYGNTAHRLVGEFNGEFTENGDEKTSKKWIET